MEPFLRPLIFYANGLKETFNFLQGFFPQVGEATLEFKKFWWTQLNKLNYHASEKPLSQN